MRFIYDCGTHFLGGVGFAGVDRLFSRKASRFTQQRVMDKHADAEALDFLVTHSSEAEGTTPQYREAVIRARDYFERTGEYGEQKSFLRKGLDSVVGIFRPSSADERVNNLSAGKKFVFSYGLELLGDIGVFISSATTGHGDGVVAVAETSYQGLAFFLGLQTGKGLLYFKDMFRSKQEKELDSILVELTKDKKLIELARNYSQTSRLRAPDNEIDATSEADENADKPKTDYGAKVGGAIVDAAEGVGGAISSGVKAIRERIAKRKEKANAEEEKRRRDFENRMKNY